MDECVAQGGGWADSSLHVVAGYGKVPGGLFPTSERQDLLSTIYYSTKVRICDKVEKILILAGRDLGLDWRDFGGWNGLFA
jgi:hypothetical protein